MDFDEDISFACASCGIELEMPRDAAGEEAECPECGRWQTVPDASDAQFDSSRRRRNQLPSEQARSIDAAETKAAPQRRDLCIICGTEKQPYSEACYACGTPNHVDVLKLRRRPRGIFVGEILHTSMRIFAGRLGVLVPAIAIETIVALLLYAGLLQFMALGIRLRADSLVVAVVAAVYVVYHVLHVGHFRFMLAIARGQPVTPHRLIWPTSGRAYIGPSLRMLVVSTIFWGATVFGLLFGVLPAIVFALLAWPCGRLVVDRDLSPGVAISQAIDMTVPQWPGVLSLTAFLFAVQFGVGLIAVGIGQVIAPLIVLCLVLPFSSLVLTVTYLRLGDEETAVDKLTDTKFDQAAGFDSVS